MGNGKGRRGGSDLGTFVSLTALNTPIGDRELEEGEEEDPPCACTCVCPASDGLYPSSSSMFSSSLESILSKSSSSSSPSFSLDSAPSSVSGSLSSIAVFVVVLGRLTITHFFFTGVIVVTSPSVQVGPTRKLHGTSTPSGRRVTGESPVTRCLVVFTCSERHEGAEGGGDALGSEADEEEEEEKAADGLAVSAVSSASPPFIGALLGPIRQVMGNG